MASTAYAASFRTTSDSLPEAPPTGDACWNQTRRTGIALGVGFTLICALLVVGSLNEGDTAAAYWLGAPGTVLGILGTLIFAVLPRKRIALMDNVLHINGAAYPQARVSTLGLTGEGFSTSQAFHITVQAGAQPIWISKWGFPLVLTMHKHLAAVLPVDDLPPERPNPFLRRWHARQAEIEAAKDAAKRRP
ncbi:MAG: hypothetical protein ACJATT_001836 [Myxococcota bacterium]